MRTTEVNQRAYLEALQIPVWVRKDLAGSPGRDALAVLKLGPGTGDTLLLCATVEEPASRIATDIARSLKAEPVWAWPAADAEGADIETNIREHLFTRVIVFGQALQKQLFAGPVPESVGSAKILGVAGMDTLRASSAARKLLWNVLCSNGLAGRRTD